MNDELMKDFLLEAFPNPERKGCPDEITLKSLAEDRLPVDDPARVHIVSCSPCYAEYRHFRQDWIESGAASTSPLTIVPKAVASHTKPVGTRLAILALAASLVAVVGGGIWLEHRHAQPSQISEVQPVDATVDLFDNGTFRGGADAPPPAKEAAPLQQVSLPAAPIHLKVILPRFSDAGRYKVNVSRDNSGNQIVASGTGEAVETGGKVFLSVALNLSHTSPGSYYLGTVRGSDDGTYYYPLKIN